MTFQVASIGGAPAIGAVTAIAPGLVGVPDLRGLTRDQAKADLDALGLVGIFVDIPTVGTEGTVYSQSPAAPASRARGSNVIVELVTNPPIPPDVEKRFTALDSAVSGVARDLTALDGKVTAAAADVSKVAGAVTALDTKVVAVAADVGKAGAAVTTLARSEDAHFTATERVLKEIRDKVQKNPPTAAK